MVTIKIDRINAAGKGVGSYNEKKVAIPFCMPGDVVEASVRRGKGQLLQVLESAPNRIQPRCIHFGACGGCAFQEIPYADQLLHKQNQVATQFEGLVLPRPMIGCENPYHYRNKMEFTFSQSKAGDRYLGLYLAKGKVFNVKGCQLVSNWFNEALEKVYKWWGETQLHAYYPPKDTGTLRTLILRESATTGQRLVMLTVSGNPQFALHKPELASFSALFDETQYSVFLRIQLAIKGQPTEFYEMHLKGPDSITEHLSDIHFQISPSAFFQPNTKQAQRLYAEALRLAELTRDDVVYDLYCGTGTLGLLASRFVKSVVGIEISRESSLDARENAKRNGIDNIEIITGSVGDVLKGDKEYPPPSVVLLDPPRMGLDPTSLAEVIALDSPKIVYISCNPETQARDVKLFLEAGYRLDCLQPVDQFPHTPHIENIAVLLKIRQN